MARKLQLTEIWVYPIKSMGGIRVAATKVMQKGLQYDRRWMLVDDENNFITQRIYPQMALFRLSLQPQGFLITHRTDSIVLPFNHHLLPQPIECKIWDDAVSVYQADEAWSTWFSEHLGISCRLVQFPEKNARPVDAQYRVGNDHVSLADGYPYLIIGQSSLDDLNQRLTERLPMDRFRPNFVFTGGNPYEEDTWSHFSIGQNRFVAVKPCSRCVLTTIDQNTGIAGKEPLATLASYRKNENKIYFGQNVIAVDHHEIFEGDEIIVA